MPHILGGREPVHQVSTVQADGSSASLYFVHLQHNLADICPANRQDEIALGGFYPG